MKIKKTSFELFVGLWNLRQNLDTPRLHLRMAAWLSRHARSRAKRLLLMAFRGSGKSTLVGLFCAWLLLHNPDLRILIIAADEELAEHMLRHVRSVLENHPLTKSLLPARREQWAADRLMVRRSAINRDPSLRAAGITSNITGARADIIICDDVEVPKTCDSSWKREQLRKALGELDFILTPDGLMLYIGTPHAEDSLYKEKGYLAHYRRLEIPLTAQTWPERFCTDTIAKIKSSVGPRIFASQMELRPVNLAAIRLDPAAIRFYDGEIAPKIIARRCYWDPAFGHARGDASVIAYVVFDEDKNAYLHDLAYLTAISDNAALDQVGQVVAFLQRHAVKQMQIEGNGLGQFLPGLLRRHLRDTGYGCAVQTLHNARPKTQRILTAFEARLAARALYAHERIRQTPFLDEMTNWQPHQPNAADDALDAVAGALLQEPATAHSQFTRQFFTQQEDSL